MPDDSTGLRRDADAWLVVQETLCRNPRISARAHALEDYRDRVQGKPIERQMLRADQPANLDDLLEEARSSQAFANLLMQVREKIKAGQGR